MAVIVAGDSLHFDLSLTNASGGTAGALGSSAITGGNHFEYSSSTKKLSGTVDNGRIVFSWVDVRDNGAQFTGTATAVRR